MPFHFSMQKILDYRVQLEEEAKIQLAKAQQMLLKEKESLQSLQLQLAEKEQDLYKDLTMEAGQRWLLENYIKGLQSDIKACTLRLQQLQEIVRQCTEMVLMRAKDRKVLEKLKEKQREHYDAAEKEHERKFNDETATLRHARQGAF